MGIKVTKELIKGIYNKYNKIYFNGSLKCCKFHVFASHSCFGRYTYSKKNDGIVGDIWIAYNVEWNEDNLIEVVVHEMIHHYIRLVEGRSGGLFGHNWRFRRQCKRIKKKYGVTIRIFFKDIQHT